MVDLSHHRFLSILVLFSVTFLVFVFILFRFDSQSSLSGIGRLGKSRNFATGGTITTYTVLKYVEKRKNRTYVAGDTYVPFVQGQTYVHLGHRYRPWA